MMSPPSPKRTLSRCATSALTLLADISHSLKSAAHQFTNRCRSARHAMFKSEIVERSHFVSRKRDLHSEGSSAITSGSALTQMFLRGRHLCVPPVSGRIAGPCQDGAGKD